MEKREFLKRMHPEQFSDSIVENVVECPRELLDFYISKLSEQNKHFDFEDFIKKLLEREVCPNLIEETGPAGGGDGKVDTETYPVSENLQQFWLNGLNKENDRWAFAVSLKSDWKTKCNSDINKIIKTQRGYKKIFFITNQSIKNNTRLQYQDKKNDETSLEITIFDKTWILDKALKTENLELLKLIGIGQTLKKKILGNNDYKNRQRSEDIDKKLLEYSVTDTLNQDVIDLSIESAILSRSMEESEDIVNSKFQRALRLAKKKGNLNAEKDIIYNICWYSYWWINDEEQFEEYYLKYENLVKEDKKIDDIEKLVNLWTLAYTKSNHNKEKINNKTELLLSLLKEKLKSSSRTIYLKSSTKISIMRITLQEDVEEQFEKLINIINEAIKFKEFDFIELSKLIQVLLPIYSKNKKYDDLYNLITEVLTERKGDIQKAEMYLAKGKVLSQENSYDAIRTLGKSLNLLYKEETSGKLIEAYVNIGANFEVIGLKYAAKNYYIAAITMFIDELFSEKYLDPFCIKVLNKLIHIEMLQGNIENILNWIEIRNILINVLIDKNETVNLEEYDEEILQYDAIISIFLLKTKKQDFNKIEEIIAKCKNIGLITTDVMAKYTIGIYDEELLKECNGEKEKVDKTIKEMFEASYKQNLPEPKFINNIEACLESTLMGNKIKVYIKGSKLSYMFGEFILALLENTFATMYGYKIFMRGDIKIILNETNSGKFNLNYKFDGIETYTININALEINNITIETQKIISKNLYEFLLNILAVYFIYDDFEGTLKHLFEDDKTFERAINHTNSLYNLNKIFGFGDEKEIEHFEIMRNNEWYIGLFSKSEKVEEEAVNLYDESEKIIYGKPDNISFDNIQQFNIHSSEMIKCTHWDVAKWKGVLFMADSVNNQWGEIGILFENSDGAKLVFKDLINYATKDDKDGKIIISFIKGINKERIFDYRVMITNKMKIPKVEEKIIIQSMFRFHNMNCENNVNLNILETLFLKNPRAELSIFPAIIKSGKIEPLLDYKIKIKQVNIKEAYTIGKHSIESMVIMKDDKPIIPKELNNAPIEELIKLRKKL